MSALTKASIPHIALFTATRCLSRFRRSPFLQGRKLAEDVKAKFGYASVTVCSDSDLFYKAKKAASMGMSESEAAALIESALKRK